jgi:hypothetical protein
LGKTRSALLAPHGSIVGARGIEDRLQLHQDGYRHPMAELDHPRISPRLRQLPSQFLVALINATTILVIAAAILALVVLARIEHFAENLAATMTTAVLSNVDLPSKNVLANIRELTGEVRALGNALREIKARENPVLESEIARLRESLTTLNVSIDRLGNSRSILTDEVAARLGDAVTRTLVTLRDCPSNANPTAPPHQR